MFETRPLREHFTCNSLFVLAKGNCRGIQGSVYLLSDAAAEILQRERHQLTTRVKSHEKAENTASPERLLVRLRERLCDLDLERRGRFRRTASRQCRWHHRKLPRVFWRRQVGQHVPTGKRLKLSAFLTGLARWRASIQKMQRLCQLAWSEDTACWN